MDLKPDARTDAVLALLGQTEAAHGVYESTELKGVYDQDWPAWYATYGVDHGIADLVGHNVGAERLAAFLERAWADFSAAEPKPGEGWAAYTARRITQEL